MVILGLDPGTATTGYGVIEKNGPKLTCVEFGCIKTSPKLTSAERLYKLRARLKKIIKKHKPELVAVEKLFFSANVKTAISVSQARGVILETISSSGALLLEFSPLQVKQAVTSYGKADKAQVQKMVRFLLALKEIPKPDDAADALAIAICTANTL